MYCENFLISHLVDKYTVAHFSFADVVRYSASAPYGVKEVLCIYSL